MCIWGWALREPSPSHPLTPRWVDNSLEVRAYSSSLSAVTSQFHFHTYSHPPGTGGGWCSLSAGNWRSLWSPVYFPPPFPPPSSPPPPHAASRPEQLGNLQQNTAVMRLPWTRTVAAVCPAHVALCSLGGTSLSWKERPLGLPIQECGRGDGFSPSSPTLAPPTILWGLAWLTWLGLWATSMSDHLSREG